MQVKNHKLKARLVMRTAFLALCALIFVVPAKAQRNVLMQNGSTTLTAGETVNFYDSHGPSEASAADGNKMRVNYWDKWYATNEANGSGFIHTFNAPQGYDVKVVFKKYTAYGWSDEGDYQSVPPVAPYNCAPLDEQWALRINDDNLYAYQGTTTLESNLIGIYTGNTENEFSIIAEGSITFHFVSNEQFREEGWAAEVTAVPHSQFVPTAPFIRRSTCSDDIELVPTTLGSAMYYTTDGTTPSPGTPYNAPIEWTSGNLTVNAVAVLDGVTSSVATATFTDADRIPTIDNDSYKPVISRVEGENKVSIFCPPVPTGLNETFFVMYTTDGSIPSRTNANGTIVYFTYTQIAGSDAIYYGGSDRTYVFDWDQPNTTFNARVFAFSCTNEHMESPLATYTFGDVYVPEPTITFTPNDNPATGSTELNCSLNGATIYYTTDGSDPTTSSTVQTYNGAFNVPAGTTVKAFATVTTTGYMASAVVSDIYIPTNEQGESQNGVYGGTVLLDDREPHTWSYYSDNDQPIHSLKPADVKITYMGNGKMYTSTSATPSGDLSEATGVKVSSTENQDTFIYLKTLERANGDAGTGNLAYTLIPNPFSVRPKFTSGGTTYYTGFYGWRVKSLTGVTISGYSVGSIIPAETEIQLVTDNGEGNEVEFEAVWARAYVTTSTSTTGLQASVGYERNFMVLNTSPSPQTNTVTIGSGNYTSQYLPTYTYNRYSLSYQLYLASEINGAGQITAIAFRQYSNSTTRNVDIYLKHTSSSTIQTITQNGNTFAEDMSDAVLVYSGNVTFNGWSTITLQTPFDYDGTSNLIVCVDDNNYNYTNRACQFYTYSTSNNNRAYYWTNDNTNYAYPFGYNNYTTSSYNNQIRFTKTTPAGNNVSNITVPCTVMGCNPDGSNQSSGTISGSITCGADLKLEHINVDGSNSSTIANNHNLIFGRGVNGTVNSVRGLQKNATYSDNVNYSIRIESGSYNFVSFYAGYTSTQGDDDAYTNCEGSANYVKATLGNDYDRAKGSSNGGNDNLSVAYAVTMGNRVGMYNQDATQKTLDLTVKSGKFYTSMGDNMGTADATESMYLGITSYLSTDTQTTKSGGRYVLIEGGEMTNIAGGVDANQTGDNGVRSFNLRMKGGLVKGAIYGAGAISPANGDRHMVFTGGNVKGWIGAGCNGVAATGSITTGGQTHGESFVYMGGKTSVGGSASINGSDGGTVFGAGKGSGASDEPESGRMSYGTNVVIADECDILNNVYGGGNYGFAEEYTNLYILGGTVQGNVFGGSNQNKGPVVTINMTNGTIQGNLYGGSNTSGTISGLSTINVSGGTVTNVFGGGLGASTIMANDVIVNISGGTINNSVYGGGQLGTVGAADNNTHSTDVTISGGEVKGSVFGAGLGSTNTTNPENPANPIANANIYGNTNVTISGGTVGGSVFGGGENGSMAIGVSGKKSTVAVSGGTINGSVYGGGSEGFTHGATVVNLSSGVIKGSAFGGAFGKSKLVYVDGPHTVNVMGSDNGIPEIYGSVYGGSRLANDGNSFTLNHNSFDASNASQLSSVVNISGARIKEHVYASGYYGRCFGSVYVNVGENAINNTNVTLGNNTNDKLVRKARVFIEGSLWAGSDWGVFAGDFGAPTVSGNSNIIVDGTDYNVTSTTYTDTDYMGIGMSILGCGTSCDAGKGERNLLVRNYGVPVLASGDVVNPVRTTTRELNSIQRFKNASFDNAHVSFKGQGKVNSLNTTEKYSIYSIVVDNFTSDANKGHVYVANGSTLIMSNPASELNSIYSVTCSNPYAATPTYTVVTRDALYNSELNGTSDNKIRVNGGSFVEVKYNKNDVQTYGELKGYFHMMSSNTSDDATCAYARPKQATDSQISDTYDNPNDGGFLSYDTHYNTYTEAGAEAGADSYQLPYENHAPSRNDTEYFRIWRFGGNHHTIDGIITVQQNGHSTDQDYEPYQTVAVTIQLPAWRTSGSYYRFDRTGDAGSYFTLIDYGVDVMTFNAANTFNNTPEGTPTPVGDNNQWMYYANGAQVTGANSGDCPEISDLSDNPDMNFGLIIQPGNSMQSHTSGVNNYIICGSSDSYIAENMQYDCGTNANYLGMPSVTFLLTYRNDIHSNTTWDPITIPLVQCNADGSIKEYVDVVLTINTMTDITSTFKTQVYAIMNGGTNSQSTTLQTITLPVFDLQQTANMDLSSFTVVKAEFEPAIALVSNLNPAIDPSGTVSYLQHSQSFDVNSFGLTLEAVMTPDNSDDWRDVQPEIDGAPGNGSNINEKIGESGGRTAVALGFNLYYSDAPSVTDVTLMGTVTFTIKFDHYANGTDPDGDGIKEGEFTVEVEVYRKGPGVNFFVDGIHGEDKIDNEKHRGLYPNFAAKSVEFVLSRLNFTAGDNIFIVNQVDVSKNLKYDGSKKQNNVNIWRYPGNHPLKSEAPAIVDNTDNKAYTGLLFNLKAGANLKVISTKIDGMYAEAVASTHDTHIFPVSDYVFNGEAAAPVFKLNDGADLMLNGISRIQNNYNGAASKADEGNAGGVYVAEGAVLAMNGQTAITSNYNSVAGGVYMNGAMIVSDDVIVNNNKKSPAGSDNSNVWLTQGSEDQPYKVVQIGNANQSSFGPLSTEANIGIDKAYNADAHTIDFYLPVVFTEKTNPNYLEDYLKEPFDKDNDDLTNNEIIFHDLGKYKLTKYTPDNYLYWLSTWVTFQDHEPNHSIVDGVDEGGWEGVGNIHTPQQLAWFISLVNGENHATATTFEDETIIIKDDIDMDGHIWVPVGTPNHPFMGTFEGNGHVITNMYGSLMQENMGMFGYTQDADIQNVVMKTDFSGTNDNLGTAVGLMNGGTLTNVEGAGSILNKLDNSNMGGLVGQNNGGTIHSAFAVADMTGGAKMGGLVGKNTGDLYNAYSYIDFAKLDGQTSNMVASGLVAENTGNVENCYVIEGNITNGSFYTFSANNTEGTIKFCYASESSTSSLVGTGDTPIASGTYGEVLGRKEIGYMYDDNKVTATNDYVVSTINYYDGDTIATWPGLLSTLNSWVKDNSTQTVTYTNWFRSTSSDINGDLPILGFPKDNSLATEDGKFLFYGSNVNANGLDNLFETFANTEANMFLYGKAVDVTKGNGNNMLFINEDAVLLQKEATNGNAMANIKAVVGVTFDNSSKRAHDYYGNLLEYDWHLMSTPLSDAKFGVTYKSGAELGHGTPADWDKVKDGYMPDMTNSAKEDEATAWDFYTYFEPEYHWINFKRSQSNHWHYDAPYDNINYTGTEQTSDKLTPGRGYMMAINKDSYLSNTGTLNNKEVKINLTISGDQNNDPAPTRDWGSNLVGNPYQAYLDLAKVASVNEFSGYTAANGFYIYDADNGTYGPYITNASVNTAVPSQFIHPHQAFFVVIEGGEGTEKELKFTYDMATATPNETSYFRDEEQPRYPVVNLFAENETGNRDLAIIELLRPEIGGVRKVNNLRNANFKIAAHLEGTSYGLLFTPEGTDRVPVRFITDEDGTFTLTWDTQNGDFSSLLLVDNMTGTITDMLRADHYTFDATTDDYVSRFYITFAVTDVEEYNEGDNDFAWFDGSEWVINGKGNLDVVDVLGRTIYSERLVNDQNRVNLNNVAKGVYMLRISEGNSTKVQKVVVR
ncbi:MAG: chitobiase/beta-hexosaminidase C-terminal domain-containing protein [Bacteroidales bacterium]|nr:chitobiase/beta-hexosaminidase C-terminal domain-containing protein [Bacteroidales bacterium]